MHRKTIVLFFITTLALSHLSYVCFAGNSVKFTEEEQKWIAAHPVIRVANETDWPPFDFNKDGEPRGMVIDHISLLAKKAGLCVEFVSGKPWGELVTLFQKKQIDVMPVFYMNEERKEFTLFTKPYHVGKLAVFVAGKEDFDLARITELNVGMETSHGSIPMVEKKFPGIKITQIDKKVDLVRLIATEKLDAIIGNPFVFYHHAKEHQIDSLRLVSFISLNEEERKAASFHIGVRKDWPVLHQILEKCMANTSYDEVELLKNRWVDVQIVKKINWWTLFEIAFLIFIVIGFLIWTNRRLKYLVKEKTKELRILNDELEKKIDERTLELSEANIKLKSTIDELQTLRGIIPICASCKKIRDDSGYWNQLEGYISKHSLAEFSHSICPDCTEKYFSD